MKPPFTYFDGKGSTAQAIAATFPARDHYVEPFAGSLAVLLAKAPARMETVNDLDGQLMTFWRVLRDQPEGLARLCALTPHSRAEYEHVQDNLAELAGDLEVARRVWVKLTQGRSGMFRRTGWRHYQDPNTSAGMPAYLAGYCERLLPAAARLRNVSLECRDALDVIRDYGRFERVLIYADPPYLGSTRTWGNNYRHELRTDDEHATLAEALHRARATVVLSGYHSSLYDDLYGDWRHVEVASRTGNGSAGEQDRTEVLWSNRPLSERDGLTLFGEAS